MLLSDELSSNLSLVDSIPSPAYPRDLICAKPTRSLDAISSAIEIILM